MNYGQPAQTDNFESISVGNGTNDPNFNGNNPADNIDATNWNVSPNHDDQIIGNKVKTLSEATLPMPGDQQNTPEPIRNNNPFSIEPPEFGKVVNYDQGGHRTEGSSKAGDIEPIKDALRPPRGPIKITNNLNESGINEVEEVKRKLAASQNPDFGTVYDEIRGAEGLLDEAMLQSFGDNSAWKPTDSGSANWKPASAKVDHYKEAA